TEMFELLGSTWVADDAACAVWSVVAFCCDDCTPPVPAADCVAAWVVGAVLAAVPDDEASFDCDEPVLGAAVAGAAASVPAACIAPARTSSSLPDVRPVGAAQPQPRLCAWVAFCVVVPV